MDINDFKYWVNCEKALKRLDHKTIVLLAADWAYSVLPIFEAEHPKNNRPRKAIEAAEQWMSVDDARDAFRDARNAAWDAMSADIAGNHVHNAASYAASAAAHVAYSVIDASWSAAYTAKDTEYAADKLEWVYKTYLYAIGPGNKVFNDKWITSTVKSLLYDVSLAPIIADALEDAGCDNNGILCHLRNDKEWTRADWVFRRLSCTC
jgi:hypothetical protein